MNERLMPENLPLLRKGAEELGIVLTQQMEAQFALFGQRLLEKNKVMNLTALTDPDEVQVKHFLDSLTPVTVTELEGKSLTVADMGTGAGFPGIPLKIAFPGLNITLMDSLKKRLNFLDEIIDENRFENIRTLHGRAEDIGRSRQHREQYDLCVSRAVANLSSLCEYCLPLVKIGGQFISFKAANASEEIKSAEKAVKLLGGEIEKIHEFVLPGTDLGRTLVVIRKKQASPAGYPRKAGTPAKDPIH